MTLTLQFYTVRAQGMRDCPASYPVRDAWQYKLHDVRDTSCEDVEFLLKFLLEKILRRYQIKDSL
jgi:hypothetical protein